MKTIYATIGLLMTAALAFPAGAQLPCDYHEETGTYLCISLDPQDLANRDVTLQQAGVGGINHYAMEFSFFGSNYRGQGVFVYTAYDSPVGPTFTSVDHYCMSFGSGDSCDFEGTTASVWAGEAASLGANEGRDSEGMTLCWWAYVPDGADVWECQTLL